MAHQISSLINASGDFVGLSEAWHGLGTITEKIGLFEAMRFGGMDYHVEKLPNHHVMAGSTIISDASFFTYRTDKNIVLGAHVGSRYEVLQNAEALGIVDQFSQYHIETAGCLRDGAVAFVCLKSDEKIIVGGTDVSDCYLTFVNSFDGTSAIRVIFSPIRVVCNNTLQFATNSAKASYSFRHTTNAGDRIKEAAKVMGLFQKAAKETEVIFNIMAKTDIRPVDYFGHVYLTEKDITALQVAASIGETPDLATRTKNGLMEVLKYYENGAGQAEWKGTAWGAYNTVTGMISNDVYDDYEEKMGALFFNALNEKRQARALYLAKNPDKITAIPGLETAIFN